MQIEQTIRQAAGLIAENLDGQPLDDKEAAESA